jgi:hypothetical protein
LELGIFKDVHLGVRERRLTTPSSATRAAGATAAVAGWAKAAGWNSRRDSGACSLQRMVRRRSCHCWSSSMETPLKTRA